MISIATASVTVEALVICGNNIIIGAPDNCMDGDIRLVSGPSDLEGTVQICVFGYWGTICDSSWDSRDAYVVCKQLGYPAIGKL